MRIVGCHYNHEVRRNFLRSLAAVLGGAAIYWALMPHLPRVARHHIFHIDAGLLLYVLISVALYILLSWMDRK